MKNELFDMYSWLRGYLYIVLLMIISSSSFAVTQKEIDMGGFAFPVICSHPTILGYCVPVEQGAQAACMLWQTNLDPKYGYSLVSYGSTCLFEGRNPTSGSKVTTTQALSNKQGLCPSHDAPPPTQVIFSRNGRWFSQELGSNRCYRSCEYSNGQSFDYKHYVFTNGVMTNFTENMNSRLKSNQKFCDPVAEPSRNSEGEITYDANCDDSFLTVFCNFVEWYRSDSEMPEAPEVENKTLDIATHLKTDHVRIEANAENLCFEPVEFNLVIPWTREEVKQQVSFNAMCNGISSIDGFLHVLYLLHAAFIIFRK